MGDCISREAAINKILGQPPDAHYPSWYAQLVEELPAANVRSAPEWISVEERLPELDKYVLVRFGNNEMVVACVFDIDEYMFLWRAQTDEGWCCDCDAQPTHWMPLPEPPVEADEQGSSLREEGGAGDD